MQEWIEWNMPSQIQNCWYNHSEIKMSDENNEDLSNQNQEIITKLFEMMETFTQRLVQIENNIWKINWQIMTNENLKFEESEKVTSDK